MKNSVQKKLEIKDKTAIITGGGGLLGSNHAEAIAEFGGNPVILDIDEESALHTADLINRNFNVNSMGLKCDISNKEEILTCKEIINRHYDNIDILINNAALDPKVENTPSGISLKRLEYLSLEQWNLELAVGLTGAFLCTQVFGVEMAKQKAGVIINISSDLGVIAPDQRLYEQANLTLSEQPVKPITYSVIKHGLIGLTKYIATYWAKDGVRANTLCPGGVYNDQPEEFVDRISNLIPMKRMANPDEYKAAIVFLASEASSYMNGQTLIIDGGRSIL